MHIAVEVRRQDGFTLLELIIVIVIVASAILAGIPSLQGRFQAIREREAVEIGKTIAGRVAEYYRANRFGVGQSIPQDLIQELVDKDFIPSGGRGSYYGKGIIRRITINWWGEDPSSYAGRVDCNKMIPIGIHGAPTQPPVPCGCENWYSRVEVEVGNKPGDPPFEGVIDMPNVEFNSDARTYIVRSSIPVKFMSDFDWKGRAIGCYAIE